MIFLYPGSKPRKELIVGIPDDRATFLSRCERRTLEYAIPMLRAFRTNVVLVASSIKGGENQRLPSHAGRKIEAMGNDRNQAFDFKRGMGQTLLIACGALARDVIDFIEMNGWRHLDVTCLPAKLHHRPQLIPEEIRRKIRINRSRYLKIFVLYGDCGTGGLLDKVLEEEGNIERIPGPHCFSFFRGNEAFAGSAEDEISTFYLTDYFCRHFEKFVWEALALDRRDDMVAFVFGNYKRLLYIPQVKDEALEQKARAIAARLGLDYEYQFCGYGDLGLSMGQL